MNEKTRNRLCPVCESSRTSTFFTQRDVPTQCGYLAPTRERALSCELGDLVLEYCAECGHVWNSAFDPDRMHFDPEYDFSQYYSPAYRAYVKGSIERLQSRYGLRGGTALDIACGKGDYLRMLAAAGFERAIGFDPTFIEGSLSEAERQRITVYRKFYDRSESRLRPDLVTCRSALQYIPKPREFLRTVRETLEESLSAILCFEVPNGAEPFRDRIVWYVMYEAGCFFSAASLSRLFRECGFEVLDVLPALNGSHLEIEARPAQGPTAPYREETPEIIAEIGRQVAGFAEELEIRKRLWAERFEDWQRAGKRVVLWAAGMRAVSLLVNVPVAAACVEYVVDVNPKRQGRYLPKTGQQVVAPESLREIRPDVVIATNPTYAQEIAEQVRGLGLECEFAVLR